MFLELDIQLRARAWRRWSPMIVSSDDNEDDSGDVSQQVMDRVVDADYTGIEDFRRCVVVDNRRVSLNFDVVW